MTTRPVVAALLGSAALLVPAQAASADTEGCASHSEVDQMDVGMSQSTVRNLFDIPGHYGPDGPDQFSLEFRTCWAPGEKVVRVWFDWIDGLSRRWPVVDA